MRKRNDGTDEVNAVQNRFTAYLVKAVQRQKYQYLKKLFQHQEQESIVDPMENPELWPEEVDMLTGLPPLAQIENQRLLYALVSLTERERYILLAHILDERNFTALAGELGLGYKGTAAIYYRAVQKVRRSMGGGEV